MNLKVARKDRFSGKRIAVLGMGRSGLALAGLLKKNGALVFISELKESKELDSEIEQMKNLVIDFETGGHTQKIIEAKDFIVISPGIPGDIPILKEAKNKGIPVFSEIEVAYWLSSASLVGITGSNGKTTVTALVGEMLKEDQKEYQVAGNIGLPFSSITQEVSEEGVIVLEISSFQLEEIEEFKPLVAALLNLTPDHLDRYPDMNSYQKAKERIFENQTKADWAVLNADDDFCLKLSPTLKSQVLFFSTQQSLTSGFWVEGKKLVFSQQEKKEEILEIDKIGIKGPHNLSNACAACAICYPLEVEISSMQRALLNFKGVEHRLEEVAQIKDVCFINDSKATNVDSVFWALQSRKEPLILIAGGKDKGGDFTKLRELVKKNVKSLILIGQAKEKIKKSLGDLVPTFEQDSLEEAVELGFEKANSGDCVLLSPGCASFDMFRNFEERGMIFKHAVLKLKEKMGE
jgi:UDP-N-acetylmuramoylalanine--D-glutamate ligase